MPTESVVPHNIPEKQAKILSFRSKRAAAQINDSMPIEPYTSGEFRLSSKQIRRRNVDNDSGGDDDDEEADEDGDENANDDVSTITIPFFDMQPKLKVNTNGDLIFEAISQRDEVRHD